MRTGCDRIGLQRVLQPGAVPGGGAVVDVLGKTVAADAVRIEHLASLRVDHVKGRAGDDFVAVCLLLHRVLQEPGSDEHGEFAIGRLNLTNGGIGPRLAHRLLERRCRGRDVAPRCNRVIEARVPRKAPFETDTRRVLEVREHRRRVVLGGRDERGHVIERDVEGLVERSARSLADDQVRPPLPVHLDVGNLR